jgi:ABC-type Fe3+-hydroxamate transport system substrate-binding protein
MQFQRWKSIWYAIFPIVEDREVKGMVSEEMILDNDPDAMILSYRGSGSQYLFTVKIIY